MQQLGRVRLCSAPSPAHLSQRSKNLSHNTAWHEAAWHEAGLVGALVQGFLPVFDASTFCEVSLVAPAQSEIALLAIGIVSEACFRS